MVKWLTRDTRKKIITQWFIGQGKSVAICALFVGERSSLTRWANEYNRNHQTSEVDEFTDFLNNLCLVENHIKLLCQEWYSTNTDVMLSLLSEHNIEAPLWTKLPNQVNRIPNHLYSSLSTGRKGCSALCFSPDGRFV